LVFRFVEHRHDLGFPSSLAGDGRERYAVRSAHAPSPSTRVGGAAARAGAGGVQEGAEHPATGAPGAEERGVLATRAAGALLPDTSEYSSSDEEEEESDGGRAPLERWEPLPPLPRAAEVAEETAPGAGAGAPAARRPTREATRAAKMAGGEAVAAPAVATAPAEPPRKRKRGFSTLRWAIVSPQPRF
jgi:hypothetical protein